MRGASCHRLAQPSGRSSNQQVNRLRTVIAARLPLVVSTKGPMHGRVLALARCVIQLALKVAGCCFSWAVVPLVVTDVVGVAEGFEVIITRATSC